MYLLVKIIRVYILVKKQETDMKKGAQDDVNDTGMDLDITQKDLEKKHL
jgi:hypothetical protein